MNKILVLDVAKEMGELIHEFLVDRGSHVHTEFEAGAALDLLSKKNFDFLLITERIQGLTPLELATRAVAVAPDLYIILASAKEDVGHSIREFHNRFRRLPVPLVLEDLSKIIEANTRNVDAG